MPTNMVSPDEVPQRRGRRRGSLRTRRSRLTLPVTGTYTLRIDPQGTATGSMTVTMNDVVDITGSITLGGSAVTGTLSTPGQKWALHLQWDRQSAGQPERVSHSFVPVSSPAVIFGKATVGVGGGSRPLSDAFRPSEAVNKSLAGRLSRSVMTA